MKTPFLLSRARKNTRRASPRSFALSIACAISVVIVTFKAQSKPARREKSTENLRCFLLLAFAFLLEKKEKGDAVASVAIATQRHDRCAFSLLRDASTRVVHGAYRARAHRLAQLGK